MNTTPPVPHEEATPGVVANEPVGHEGARANIKEKKVWSLGAGVTAVALVALIAIMIASGVFFVQAINNLENYGGNGADLALLITSIIVFTVALVIALTSVKVVSPGHTLTVQFFGRYIGTLRRTGLSFVPPLSITKRVSVRVRNFETNEAKVNDYNGNPINISSIIVWQVADTAQASFSVEDFEEFLHQQAESALRHVATQHPYDSPVDGRISLRGSTDDVSEELADEVAQRAAVAGLEIIEARISSLSYAPEIAQAMLQRQQASAIVDAREKIVEGAVTMVETALEQLEQRQIVDLDPERRAAMVSNLLVVLCSDTNAQPMVNAGSLYH
ncbi:SPFH domain-containing protein [Corynebacterium crudilactis]|uniref:Band 7 protein n=1 Tax=Corynebacterium crudilactis TaxID=1652495 RepID=A0A172QWG4_9CORY|nr:SPFH domain-containing protein [Corynebacterium crudilactis]ANE04986.1 band 7 protein [Corynebacterium crudilactis]